MAVKPSAEDLERFEEVSPIAHVGAVTAPLLFMLGAKDRRWAGGLHRLEADRRLSTSWIHNHEDELDHQHAGVPACLQCAPALAQPRAMFDTWQVEDLCLFRHLCSACLR